MKLFGDKAKHNLSTNSTNLIRGDIKMNKMWSQRPESLHSGSEPATAKAQKGRMAGMFNKLQVFGRDWSKWEDSRR